jgi:hypothetical protein
MFDRADPGREKDSDSQRDRPAPLMQTTPGITAKRFSHDPLGTEGEMTRGPDDANPYEDPDAAREARRRAELERQERDQMEQPSTAFYGPIGDPTVGDDPFAFDDIDPGLPAFGEGLDVELNPLE